MRDESGQTCLTRSQLETLLSGQSAAAGAPLLRDTVEAPTGQPSSSEDDDSSDSTQPTSASVQSATTSAPDGAKSVENLDFEEEIASESIAEPEDEPELAAANHNSPAEALLPTGTDD